MVTLNIESDIWHPEWNYTLKPDRQTGAVILEGRLCVGLRLSECLKNFRRREANRLKVLLRAKLLIKEIKFTGRHTSLLTSLLTGKECGHAEHQPTFNTRRNHWRGWGGVVIAS